MLSRAGRLVGRAGRQGRRFPARPRLGRSRAELGRRQSRACPAVRGVRQPPSGEELSVRGDRGPARQCPGADGLGEDARRCRRQGPSVGQLPAVAQPRQPAAVRGFANLCFAAGHCPAGRQRRSASPPAPSPPTVETGTRMADRPRIPAGRRSGNNRTCSRRTPCPLFPDSQSGILLPSIGSLPAFVPSAQ